MKDFRILGEFARYTFQARLVGEEVKELDLKSKIRTETSPLFITESPPASNATAGCQPGKMVSVIVPRTFRSHLT